MLETLFGSPIIEKILFYLLVNEKGYGSKLRKIFNIPLYSVQRALAKLERGGVVAAQLEGKTRIYRFNPRYPLLNELKAFLQKAYDFLPQDRKEKYYEPILRKRPRRKGKPPLRDLT